MSPSLDLTPLAPLLNNGAFLIDNSTFEAVLECMRKSLYRIVHKRNLVGDNNALNFGSAVHAAMEVRFRRGGFAIDSLNEQFAAGERSLEERPVDPSDWRTKELLYDCIQSYALTHAVEPWQSLAHPETQLPLVELPFAIPLGEISLRAPITVGNRLGDKQHEGPVEVVTVSSVPVIWTGKLDLPIIHNGELWSVDHKTTSVFGEKYFEDYYLSNQMIGYTWTMEQLFERPCAGVCINVFAIRKPTATGKGTTFGRQFIRYPRELVSEWKHNTLVMLTKFFEALQDQYFPMNMLSCRNKYHRTCDYRSVCLSDDAERQELLYSNVFENVTWSPLD